MTAQKTPRRMPPRRWASLEVSETRASYVLRTRSRHDKARNLAEQVLTGVCAALIIGAYLMMLMPQSVLIANSQAPGYLFPMMMVAMALGLYAVATRGHSPEVRLDKVRNRIWICSRNRKGDARVQTRLSKSDIQSVFVQRPEDKSKDAKIVARLRGKARPVVLVRGRPSEIEEAMRDLCAVLRAQPSTPMRRFANPIEPRRVTTKAKAQVA